MVGTQVTILGYSIKEELYNGSRTLVYRGVREKDEKPVVIKLLKNPYPIFNELLQFRNQYTIAKNLEITGIVHSYSLENYGNSYALVMEDIGGISLQEYMKIGHIASVEDVLSIMVQITDILHNLHQNSVIHKDIKPANILINPQTCEIKLIDFSIASLLPKETQEIKNPNSLEGTLAYLSPEQTGRMNRGVDYRSDFYALGVTFYELITGELPFKSDDAMELVYCHIAKQPPAIKKPHPSPLLGKERELEEIPQVLSDIVMKLMAKNAEDRYQSAFGLKYDLEICLKQLKETGNIENFQIAQRDICDRFIIPEKLYGRESEVKELLAAFERVSKGNSELMLVAGFSGIGKTAVVNEVHKPIVKQRGYFIKGKFDQFNRNIPLDAFVQAFRDLMEQLKTESDAQLSIWKNKILQALGDNAGVIVEVIPELAQIIGKQPLVSELSGAAAQNRFNLLFQKFIQVFTQKEHPLVIFLDDLQWIDSASNKFINLLIGKSKTNYLLLIGAYRDNEVFPAHPLNLMLNEMEKTGAIINTITLKVLSQLKLNKLIVETLKCREDSGFSLSQPVHRKTQGNPFFAIVFLKYLYQHGMIRFNFEEKCWQCDISQINQQSLTKDVVEFMVFQLQRLPESTQNVLKLAACIGNNFDLKTLAIICQLSEVETAASLWQALQEELILPENQVYKFYIELETQNRELEDSQVVNYKFLHDRVQQAAYSLIPEKQRQTTHLKIGRLLWQNLSQSEVEKYLFTIVNHLNIGCDLISEQWERDCIARLNLQASQKAKASVAYETSRRYCYAGQLFLQETSWQNNYSLRFALAIATIEAECLNHNLPVVQNLLRETLEKAQTMLARIKVHELQILFEINQNKMNEAISLALDVLIFLGINIPTESQKIQAEIELLRQEIALPTEEIANLATFEAVKDEEKLAAIRILTNATSAAYIANPRIFPLIVLHTVRQCIKYGHSALAASAYSWYGALLCGVYNEIEAGYEFGKLSLQLLEKFNARTLAAKVSNMFNVFIRPWKEHVKNATADLPEAIQSGFENGDVEYAFYAAVHYCNYFFYSGSALDKVCEVQQRYLPEIIKAQYGFHEGFLRINQQVVLNLLGEADKPQSLQGSVFNREDYLSQWLENNIVFLVLCFYEAQTRLAYLFEDNIKALEAGEKGWQYRQAAMGTLYISEHNFYYSLALLANGKLKEPEHHRVADNQNQLKIWAEFSPSNFQHKYNLVEAERHRIQEQKAEAIELYDKAIAAAKINEYIHEEALANELAAKFYLNWGKNKVAAGYMQEAYYCYARWGSSAKTDDLEQRYPDLLYPILHLTAQSLNPVGSLATIAAQHISIHRSTSINRSSSTSINTALDFTTILKASQALSSTIQLAELLCQLTQIILQNSGGDSTALILPNRDGELYVEAIATAEETELTSQPLANNPNLPSTLIHYVKNTQVFVVIDNLNTDLPVIGEYLLEKQPKSVLCLPILNQGQLIGVLYLENSSTSGVFTSDRILILNFLCTQAAISLENARLYAQEQEKTREIAQKEAEYRSIFESSNDGLSIVDLETGQLIASNPTYSQMYGYTEEEFLSLIPPDFIHSDYVYLFSSYLVTLNAGDEFYTQCIGKRKDGSYFDVEVKAVPFIYKGKPHGLTIVRDISKQKAILRQREEAEASVIQKSQELEKTLQELKQAQLQMVQNEKLATLGNLVAGVAHEVNNPIGFLKGSIGNAEEYIKDLFAHIQCYEESYPTPEEDVNEHAEDIDLEFIREDLPKLLDSMKLATGRIKDISTSLRTFSRADTSEKVACNIHEGIDSTILILKYRLKADEKRPAIEVIKEYCKLPLVKCF
ncbi:MAG: AAA family ATPase [Rivularia sp. (in: cyanobacteria)]